LSLCLQIALFIHRSIYNLFIRLLRFNCIPTILLSCWLWLGSFFSPSWLWGPRNLRCSGCRRTFVGDKQMQFCLFPSSKQRGSLSASRLIFLGLMLSHRVTFMWAAREHTHLSHFECVVSTAEKLLQEPAVWYEAPVIDRCKRLKMQKNFEVHLCTAYFSYFHLNNGDCCFNVFHVCALYYTKTLITNKCTTRVLSPIVTHSYMFRPCWVIFRQNFFYYRYTKVALYSWVRICCWLCTALFLEAWTLCGPGLHCSAGRDTVTVHSQQHILTQL
jgi:hypothetical protein